MASLRGPPHSPGSPLGKPSNTQLVLLLCLLQVHSFSNRSNEHSLRVTSLDHLGVIAARLRRDAAHSVDGEHEELVSILAQVYTVVLLHF